MISLRNLLEFERSSTNSKGRKKPVLSVAIHGGPDNNLHFTNKIFIFFIGIIHTYVCVSRGKKYYFSKKTCERNKQMIPYRSPRED